MAPKTAEPKAPAADKPAKGGKATAKTAGKGAAEPKKYGKAKGTGTGGKAGG